MRFTAALVAGSLALAASATTTSSVPDVTVSLSPAQSSTAACVKKCDVTDVGCLAACNPVPNPDKDQIKQTTECVAACPQGDGTAAETKKYADCTQECISKYFYNSSSGTPQPTGSSDDDSSSSSTGTDAAAATTTGTATDSDTTGTATTTETDASATTTVNKSSSDSASATDADSTTDTESASGSASPTGDNGDAASGLMASSAALFGAIVAMLAL